MISLYALALLLAADPNALPTLAPLVENVRTTVVNVEVQARAPATEVSNGTNGDEFFRRHFGGGNGSPNSGTPQGRSQLRQSAGSGFVLDAAGLVITNHHVVDGALAIRITFDDGREFDAQVIGSDAATDIAVVKLKGRAEGLPTARLGDSDALKVGDWVVAIGNPFGLASSVSAGIVSAKARNIQRGPYDDFLQTDAAINPGNSGGPLFNLKGEVVGINTALVGGSTGIGFAVPSNLVKALLPQLLKQGRVTRAYLGLQVEDIPPDVAKALKVPATEGALVVRTEDSSPSREAGVKADDVVVALDGQKIPSGSALMRAVALKTPGTTSTLALYRGPQKLELKVALATRPDAQPPKPSATAVVPPDLRKLGIAFRDVDARTQLEIGTLDKGALLIDVAIGSPAQKGGLVPGMVILAVGMHSIRGSMDLTQQLQGLASGTTLLFRVFIPGVPGRHLRAVTLP